MIDSHCHLDFAAFSDDLARVLRASHAAGVTRFLNPGVNPAGWQRQSDIALHYGDIDLAFGYHPWFLPDSSEGLAERLEAALDTAPPSLVAVGEIGLDATTGTPAHVQEAIFTVQLKLAKSRGLPVILHHRKTHHRLLGLLKQTGFDCGGIIHAFSGSEQDARKYRDLGFLLGIGGTVTYERAQKTRQTIAAMTPEDIVLETDSPDMPVAGKQGERNTPANLPEVVTALSAIWQMETQAIVTQTTKNYCRLFALP